MRRLRRALTAIIVLLVALVVASVVVLRTLDFTDIKNILEREVTAATGRELAINGNVRLALSLVPSLTVDDITFANVAGGSRSHMAILDHMEIQVRLRPLLSGEIHIERLVLNGLDLLLETDQAGRGNWVMGQSSAAEPEGKMALPTLREVLVRDGRVVYNERKGGARTEARLANVSLRSKGVDQPIEFTGSGAYQGFGFAASGSLGSLDQLAGETGAFPLTLNMNALGITSRIDGTVTRRNGGALLDLHLLADLADWSAIKSQFGESISLPALPSAKLSGRLKGEGTTYTLSDLSMTAGKSDLAGSLKLALGSARPSIDADLSSQLIDLTELLPPPPPPPPPAPKDKVFSDDPLPVSGLWTLDAAVSLRAKRIVHRVFPVDDVDAKIALRDGRLEALPLRFKLMGGQTTLAGTLASGSRPEAPAALALKIDAAGINTPKLLEALGHPRLLEGADLETHIDVAGRGTSVAGMMGTLNGTGLAVLDEGKIHNRALALGGSDLVNQIVTGINPFATNEDYTVLRCGVVRLAAKDGMVDAEDGIAAETEQLFVTGGGRANLKTEEIDIAIKPEARKELSVNFGSLASLVRIKGTLADPTIEFDEIAALKEAASAGAAVATYGLSILAERVLKRLTSEGKPCETLLAKKASPASPSATPPAAAPSPPPPANQSEGGIGGFLRGLGRSLGDAVTPKGDRAGGQ